MPASLPPSKSAAFCRLPGPCCPGFAFLGCLLPRRGRRCAACLLRRLCPVLVGRLLFAALRSGDALIRMLHGFAFDRLFRSGDPRKETLDGRARQTGMNRSSGADGQVACKRHRRPAAGQARDKGSLEKSGASRRACEMKNSVKSRTRFVSRVSPLCEQPELSVRVQAGVRHSHSREAASPMKHGSAVPRGRAAPRHLR